MIDEFILFRKQKCASPLSIDLSLRLRRCAVGPPALSFKKIIYFIENTPTNRCGASWSSHDSSIVCFIHKKIEKKGRTALFWLCSTTRNSSTMITNY